MDRVEESLEYSLYVPCAAGVEEWLVSELRAALGAGISVQPGRGGARVHLADAAGCADAALRINLESRLGQRVLWCVAHASYRHEDDLYALARAVRWGDWITPRQTLRVDVTSQHSPLRSLNFAALRIKDAICDQLRETQGERPNVDTLRPELPVLLHLGPEDATLYVDTSGEALFKRGWREDTGEAPLKETLAAAMLAAAQWQGRAEDGPLLDPCCGAGTIAIEAAQMACGIAPGSQRRFAFERLGPFRELQREWQDLRAAAQARVHAPAVPIYAGDVAFRMTDFATRNAERAGVRHAIDFKTGDALQRPPPAAAGTLMLNPPYGERIGAKGTLGSPGQARTATRESFEQGTPKEFFGALASHWKRSYSGWSAWILSPDMKLPGVMRLKESRRVPMWNGPIECRLFRFDMVAGSARSGAPTSTVPTAPAS
jgi:putative N6-adenine-specific DNA methylase